jgi:hypothetical protein
MTTNNNTLYEQTTPDAMWAAMSADERLDAILAAEYHQRMADVRIDDELRRAEMRAEMRPDCEL